MSDFGPATSLIRQKELKEREIRGENTLVRLSPSELAAIEHRTKAIDALFGNQVRAKYKLEVHFGKGRTCMTAPYAGAITCWLSGTKLHGGGDEKMYECPGEGCGALITPKALGHSPVKGDSEPRMVPVGYCGECGSTWPADQLVGERFYRLTNQNWAYAILKTFRRLEMDADIYSKYHPTDIRYKAAMEVARDRGGEEIAQARRNRGLHIYPLRNIINDTKHGADLYGRIRAFISS